jgi:hypothetical protein
VRRHDRLWTHKYGDKLDQGLPIDVLICANAARSAFEEVDLRAMHTFANLAAALWMAHDVPRWLRTIDYTKLPVRTEGTWSGQSAVAREFRCH